MRRLLLILMIALLPVRGWASDVMTVASAAQQMNAIASVADYAIPTRAKAEFDGYFAAKPASSMPWDCPWRAKDVGPAAQDGIDTASNSASIRLCNGCNTCQLCMALATGVNLPVVDATVATYPVPLPGNSGFSSANLPPGFKPPIA